MTTVPRSTIISRRPACASASWSISAARESWNTSASFTNSLCLSVFLSLFVLFVLFVVCSLLGGEKREHERRLRLCIRRGSVLRPRDAADRLQPAGSCGDPGRGGGQSLVRRRGGGARPVVRA